jgi:hypothetical protein
VSWWRKLRGRSLTPALVFAGWFSLSFALMLWAQGVRPRVFVTPDEALNRYAALTIRRTGKPFIALPFPDPEDVAHPRAWYSLNDRIAIPVYPPVLIYAYALLTYLRDGGYLLIIAWPASGIGAFAAGTAALLPPRRRFLGALAPLLGAPALYWFIRPWMNISSLLAALAWALFAWSRWRTTGRNGWLAAALLAVGAGSAVRPDYTAYVLPCAALLCVAVAPSALRRILAWTFVAGLAALVANLALNRLITGHAFQAAYQLAITREEGAPAGPRWLNLINSLLFPMGLPDWKTLLTFFYRYWIALRPLVLLLVAELTLWPLLARDKRWTRRFRLAAILLAIVFMLSRMDRGLFGAERPEGSMLDSIPRYWAPVYLFAALPPLLFVGRLRQRLPFAAGLVFLGALAIASINEVRLSFHHDQRVIAVSSNELASMSERLPQNAIVYTPSYDKVLWSHFLVADAEDPKKTARSMRRALERDYAVYFWLHPKLAFRVDEYKRALAKRGLGLERLTGYPAFYRVQARADDRDAR